MSLFAGQVLSASDAGHLQTVVYSGKQSGNAGSQQAVTTTETDCLNASVTFSTATAAVYVVTAHFDLDASASGASVTVGRLAIDGVTQSDEAHLSAISTARSTPGQVWTGTVSGAGSHTFKLRVLKSAAAGTINCVDQHTKFVVLIIEIV